MFTGTVSAEEMQAGQLLTGITLVIFLLAGFFPAHASRIRIATGVVYAAGMGAFLLHFMLR